MFWINLTTALSFYLHVYHTRVCTKGYYRYSTYFLLLSLRIAIVIDLALHAVHGLFLFDGIATQVR
jgi:hypothetical protein